MNADVERLRTPSAERCHSWESTAHQRTSQPRERAKGEGGAREHRPDGATALLDKPDPYLALQKIQPRHCAAPGRSHVV